MASYAMTMLYAGWLNLRNICNEIKIEKSFKKMRRKKHLILISRHLCEEKNLHAHWRVDLSGKICLVFKIET